MFGSLHIPRGREIKGYGIGEETADFRSFAVLMFRPFTASAAIFRNRFKGAKPDATRTPETVSA
jgi:hypothetical protein